MADALHYAHKRGFVHRDLKPANILLGTSVGTALRGVPDIGVPHVADCGLAVSEETQRTLAGQVAGTPAYMSPEQCRGAAHNLGELPPVTIFWALGVANRDRERENDCCPLWVVAVRGSVTQTQARKLLLVGHASSRARRSSRW